MGIHSVISNRNISVRFLIYWNKQSSTDVFTNFENSWTRVHGPARSRVVSCELTSTQYHLTVFMVTSSFSSLLGGKRWRNHKY